MLRTSGPWGFPFTIAVLGFATCVEIAAVIWRIDVFEMPWFDIVGIEHSEFDEIAIAFLLTVPAFFVDHAITRQRSHITQLHAEQLRVLRATTRTVQDIVSANLNQLRLRLETEGLALKDTLEHFDQTIQGTVAQLEALGNLTVFAETPRANGSRVDLRASEIKVMIRCPKTKVPVWTGTKNDRTQPMARKAMTLVGCPECHSDHVWNSGDSFFADQMT